jgi:hypothetical protein
MFLWIIEIVGLAMLIQEFTLKMTDVRNLSFGFFLSTLQGNFRISYLCLQSRGNFQDNLTCSWLAPEHRQSHIKRHALVIVNLPLAHSSELLCLGIRCVVGDCLSAAVNGS